MTREENRASIEDVLAEFDAKHEILTALCAKTKGLIEVSLQDAGIKYQSVQARIKTKKKLQSKYLDPEKQYKGLGDIHDLAGLRVITYYEDDVDRVTEVIKREFEVDGKNSLDKRRTEPDRFGYSAVNLVCAHSGKRTADVEYKRFSGIPCEIQITSILSHAWSEIEHEWYDLKEAYPDEIKRRFSRLAALFEIAGTEFLEIHKARALYERSVALRVEAKVPNIPVDAVSLKSFIVQEPLVGEIDNLVGSLLALGLIPEVFDVTLDLRSRALRLAGLTTLQEVRDALRKHKDAILEFVSRCKKEDIWPSRRGARLQRGVSVYHLSLLLVSRKGSESTLSFLRELKIEPESDLERESAIAKEVMAKYQL